MEGVGAFTFPAPPVADVYQSRLDPAAVSAVAAIVWQYVTGLTTGAAGMLLTVTVIAALGPSQTPVDWLT